ncbi:MAG: glycosyltransferase family 4 protein [Alphaproteobacteria bacterium]
MAAAIPTEPVHFLVAGPLDQQTGGYRYDRRVIGGLESVGLAVNVHELAGRFPDPDAAARGSVADALAMVATGGLAVIDSLCLAAADSAMEHGADRVRVVALVHHPASRETGLPLKVAHRLAEAERATLGAAARVIATSEHTAGILATEYGVPRAAIGVVAPGVDPAPLAAGSGEGALTLLTVGSVVPRKGHRGLLRALAPLRHLDWRLECHGSLSRHRANAAAVKSLVARLGLGDRVRLRGETGDDVLAAAYHGADLFVLASHYEGYGMVIDEALARGLPVVASAGGAVPEIAPEDATLLVPPGDVAALSEALGRAIGEPSLRATLAAGARRRRRELRGWHVSVDRFRSELVKVAK